ncbi:MAG: hypothetical protein H6Q95_240 [Nitrospirae bacterium]|nr:hypothetical protein [Nitrospirota bacterium]
MRLSQRVSISLTVLLLFTAHPLQADESRIKASGYIKNFLILTDTQDDASVEALSRLRLRLDIAATESSSIEFAYELLPRLRESKAVFKDSATQAPAILSYRAFDLDEMIYPEDETSGSSFLLAQNLDRLILTLKTPSYDLYIGRQPIAFGSAHVINPTDIIAPFTYNTIAKEELVGVDAVRIKRPLSEMGELDMGLVFGDDFKPNESAAFFRLKTYQLKTDIAFMAMVFRENLLASVDIARSIGGAGAWLEAAQVFANAADDYRPDENYFRLSIGSDYSFAEKSYAYIEYHYNGAGKGSKASYGLSSNETAYKEGAVYLLGRHYLAPGFTYEIMPLLTFSGNALINLSDHSLLLSPVLEYSVKQDVYANIGAFIGIGDVSSLKSEFGLYPDVYYAAMNIYF